MKFLNKKTIRTHICLVLVAFLLLSMVPFGALAARKYPSRVSVLITSAATTGTLF